MADDANQYWREVFKGAWRNTLRGYGWDPKKIILAIAGLIGSWMLGIVLVPATATGAFLVGILILAPFVFVWGMIQAQADMYRDLAKKQSEPAVASVKVETNHLATPKPDYAMWRHQEELTLLQAAQLWAGVRPSLTWARAATSQTPTRC